MKTKIKQKWINALTSGEYKQICSFMRGTKEVKNGTRNQLTGRKYTHDEADMSPKNNHMCVMGVLADLAFRESGLNRTVKNWLKFADDNEWPSKRTLEWAGLEDKRIDDLVSSNDKSSRTFKELARYIDKNL